ncbi:uncharacterized protein LOC132918954 [Rhopalosiphum padi]|uniref:uncharacterized protein LOC132918954 n=1 Tax=Rhopalosiphum padi TaxID=40932 RepID=UPI00298E034A|nr:uncharacterized protein LOC132918954 [Rhopalosiphum padi]
MNMNSFAIKLMIIIITFSMIFIDASADSLAYAGFFSEDNGLLNVINLFSNIVNKYLRTSLSNYESMIIDSYDELYTTDHTPKSDSIKECSIDVLYMHSIIFKMKQTKINNVETWCKSYAVITINPDDLLPPDAVKEQLDELFVSG